MQKSSTKMNADSSRPHLVTRRVMVTANGKNSEKVTHGMLSLVDLAGSSERLKQSGASAY